MTVDTQVEALPSGSETADISDTSIDSSAPATASAPDMPVPEAAVGDTAKKAPAKKSASKKGKTIELVLTVTGTADGEWHAELKQGSTYLARNLAVAAAAVSRAAKELHDDLATPIDEIIEEARSQQAAKVAALEAELEAARKILSDLN